MSQIYSPIAPRKLVSPESIDLTKFWSRGTGTHKNRKLVYFYII